jgi:hypothetical protein
MHDRLRWPCTTVPPAAAPQRSGLQADCRSFSGRGGPGESADALNDMVVMVCLLYGSARPSLGAEADLAYLVRRLRDVWPDLDIELRPAGPHPTDHRRSAPLCDLGRNADRSAQRPATQTIRKPTPRAGPPGRRTPLHRANPPDQGRRGSGGEHPRGTLWVPCETLRLLAVPGVLRTPLPASRRLYPSPPSTPLGQRLTLKQPEPRRLQPPHRLGGKGALRPQTNPLPRHITNQPIPHLPPAVRPPTTTA